MSGIVGSKFNIRGSGLVGSLGTDGQHMLSSGAGKSNVFEDAAGGGAWNLIKTLTASSSATLSFVNGTSAVVLDSTYNHYVFAFNSIHSSAVSELKFQCSVDTGSNYNTNILSCYFVNYVSGTADDHSLERKTGNQDATDFQRITTQQGTENDASASGELHLFNPASTVYDKQFRSWSSVHGTSEYQYFTNSAGRSETTSAIDAVQFKMDSGNIDAGTISLFGLSTT